MIDTVASILAPLLGLASSAGGADAPVSMPFELPAARNPAQAGRPGLLAATVLPSIQFAATQTISAETAGISVDRFGLGSTSIRALRRVPIDEIKLDRTLVAVLDPARAASEVDVEITKLAMQVSQSFGADTVAVGVERIEQARSLIALGCTRMQGHLFEAALPADELVRRFVDGALAYPAIS